MPPTRHDYLKVLLVFDGQGELAGDGWSRRLETGGVIAIPPGCEHRIVDRSPLSLYVLCFRPDEFHRGGSKQICRSGTPCALADRGGELRELTRRLLHEQATPTREAGCEEMARGLGWQILAHLARAPDEEAGARPAKNDPTGSRARVAEAALELLRRFFEPLRIDDAARRARLGRRRFTQLFLEVNGVTWWEALNRARLAHAERLLTMTDRSVAAVGFECGFGDLSGFYRAWTAAHGTSPQAWRKARAR